eukprot:399488_1
MELKTNSEYMLDVAVNETLFNQICENVEILVLCPTDNDLIHIFYETFAEKKPIISLETIQSMFSNVTDLYLRDITFNPKECNNLLEFISSNPKTNIKRIFYAVNKICATRDIAKAKLRLHIWGWDFSVHEQIVFKKNE